MVNCSLSVRGWTGGLVDVLRQENRRTRETGCIFKTEEHKNKRVGCIFKTREQKNKRVGRRQLGYMRT